MKPIRPLLLGVVLLLSTPFIACAKTPSETIRFQIFRTHIKGISYSVDPRIELLQTVMLLAGNPQINSVGIDYKLAIVNQFAAYGQHPLINFIQTYAPQGKLFSSIDAPIWYMLHLTPELEWRKDLINPYEKQPLLDSLRVLLKAFVIQSRYADFFNSNAQLYRVTLSSLHLNLVDQDEKTRLLAYYGVNERKPIRFNVILNFLGYGNFGPRFETPTVRESYAIVAPTGSYDRLPTFNHNELYGLIWHEFGHSFGNSLVEEHLSQFETLAALWQPIKVSMQAQAYHEWKVVLWEHLVNAVMCRLAASKYGENYADMSYVRPLLGKQWIYLTPLLKALKQYEASRHTYPTLRSFMPEIVNVFRRVEAQDIERWQQGTMLVRQPDIANLPLLGDIYGQKNVLFILATAETNQDGHARLRTYVEAHQAALFPSAKVVDDTLAMSMDLSKYHLFVVGTPWGNRFLQQVLPQLPIRLTAREVVIEKKYEGTGYLFMSGWVNPYNVSNIMAIYTAQDPADLVNFAFIPRGSTHYHIAKGSITLKAENYQRRGLIWSCQ